MYVLPYYKVQASVFAIIVAIWAGTEKYKDCLGNHSRISVCVVYSRPWHSGSTMCWKLG